MSMKDVNKVDYKKERLNQMILKDIQGGMTWTEVSEKYEVNMNYIRSVYSTYKVQMKTEEVEKGGIVRYWNGQRLTDGKPSPVKTYNINDLSLEERKELGLE
ncbi:hypothetical protein EVJ24_14980 [Exiguobacterium sp. SH1S21]|uniref:hypothetical protein n=1 Tax=Exiguobacterium sp. SH1S21 TaxID=2510953 RepID=UPI00103B0F84|nr:hypothetical protein [Exiguobacterium sp. SH1S21]TCI50310.1 hypothetical protein EVJ24_14980 [Exiguobacterium sp. SH1S21]